MRCKAKGNKKRLSPVDIFTQMDGVVLLTIMSETNVEERPFRAAPSSSRKEGAFRP
jgi:hypothetical protein